MQAMSYTGPLAGLLNFVAGARKANKTPHEQKPTARTRGEQMVINFNALYSTGKMASLSPGELYNFFSTESMKAAFQSEEVPEVIQLQDHPEQIQSRMSVQHGSGIGRLVVDLTKDGIVMIYDNHSGMTDLSDSVTAEYMIWLREKVVFKKQQA